MKRTWLILLVLQLVIIPSQILASHGPTKHVLFEKNSLYQFIRVLEDSARRERYVLVDNTRKLPQGGINIDDPEKLLFEYTRLSFVSLAFLDREPGDVLFVGLGAGVMPRYLSRYYGNTDIDVVEIDPDIFEVAKLHFQFVEKERMKVHIADGRVFIKRVPKKYDLIFLDAYRGDHIPFHLTTREFLKEVKKKLNDGGVVVSNILSEANNKYFWSMIKTYRKVFPQLYIFKGEESRNHIFVATGDGKRLKERLILAKAEKVQSAKEMDISLQRMPWDYEKYMNLSRYDWSRAKVLTDDFAPVNLLKYKKMDNY